MTPSLITVWLKAMRIHTLPLSIASVGTGNLLAYQMGHFSWTIAILSIGTGLLLQILSNLANDLGDAAHLLDKSDEVSTARMTATGAISPACMTKAVLFFIVLTILCGISLIASVYARHHDPMIWPICIGLGLLSILAALAYTLGKKPYGYLAGGDLSVLVFFGWIAVCGTAYLQTHIFDAQMLLPATAMGLWCVMVLNINNIRDIQKDTEGGKITLANCLGLHYALIYHAILLILSVICWGIYLYSCINSYMASLLLLFTLVLSIIHYKTLVHTTSTASFNQALKRLSLGIMLQFILLLLNSTILIL